MMVTTNCLKYSPTEMNLSMLIYNRWGQKLYETTQLNDGWDGRTTAGRKSPEGTYFYIIHFGEKTHKGSFSLLR